MKLHYLAKVWIFGIYIEKIGGRIVELGYVASSVGSKHLLIGIHPSFIGGRAFNISYLDLRFYFGKILAQNIRILGKST